MPRYSATAVSENTPRRLYTPEFEATGFEAAWAELKSRLAARFPGAEFRITSIIEQQPPGPEGLQHALTHLQSRRLDTAPAPHAP